MKQLVVFVCVLLIRSSFGTVTKVDCSSDPIVCTDPVCKLTPLNRTIKLGSYGCTPVRPSGRLWIRITQFKKTSANVYMPGNFDLTKDACDALDAKSMTHEFIKILVNNVEPGSFEDYAKALHPCPYITPWRVNLTHDQEPRQGVLNTPDEFKARVRVYNKLNQTFYLVNVHYSTRRGY